MYWSELDAKGIEIAGNAFKISYKIFFFLYNISKLFDTEGGVITSDFLP